MRPLRLLLDGFGSYREPTEADFSEVNFFALTGLTGFRKSTLIDGLCFALYGTVPRWGKENVIAHALAPAASACRVGLVFEAGGKRYAAVRALACDRQGRYTPGRPARPGRRARRAAGRPPRRQRRAPRRGSRPGQGDESALRRPWGGPKMMRAQLEHLLRVTELPEVTLQIVPFHAGLHAAAGGPFTISRFPGPDLPDLVYLEQLHSALYLDQPDHVTGYLTVMDQLSVQAETGAASQDMPPRTARAGLDARGLCR